MRLPTFRASCVSCLAYWRSACAVLGLAVWLLGGAGRCFLAGESKLCWVWGLFIVIRHSLVDHLVRDVGPHAGHFAGLLQLLERGAAGGDPRGERRHDGGGGLVRDSRALLVVHLPQRAELQAPPFGRVLAILRAPGHMIHFPHPREQRGILLPLDVVVVGAEIALPRGVQPGGTLPEQPHEWNL